MLNLTDVLTCRRVINYEGYCLEYTTGLCGEVYLNATNCFSIVQNLYSNNFGYIQGMDDFAYLLRKYNCLSTIVNEFDDSTIAMYLYENNIDIDTMITLCNKSKCNKFKDFLTKAKETINKYGIYVPDPKMRHYSKVNNQDKNLSERLDLDALSDGAYRLGMYEDQLYLDIADAIYGIVFNSTVENTRNFYNLRYEDYVSDYISDYEYDMIAYCCDVVSYLLKYSDIGVYGLEVFMKYALEVAIKEYNGNKSKRNKSNSNMIDNLFDNAVYNQAPEKVTKKKHLTQDEIDDFRRYM